MNRPIANPQPSGTARSYQQLLTKLLRHGAYPQLRKIIDKTLPADIAPVLPLLIEEDRTRVLSLLIEAVKAARTLLDLDETERRELLENLDDSALAAICRSSAPDDAADLLDELDEQRERRRSLCSCAAWRSARWNGRRAGGPSGKRCSLDSATA